MTKFFKNKEGKGLLLVIVVVVILLVLVFVARQKKIEEPELTTPEGSVTTPVTEVTPPAESELDEKIDELEAMLKDFGSDLKAGKSLDFSDLDPDDKTSAKFEDL